KRQIMIVLVDHDIFRSVPAEERADKYVLDTRGIWGDAIPGKSLPAIRRHAA
ncbi:hypothetical protein JMG10_49055, partial [Nostoc ellipsosporum NOK]|nr:hypothetical protein [Nostoc ellipsosporum NOK]